MYVFTSPENLLPHEGKNGTLYFCQGKGDGWREVGNFISSVSFIWKI